MEGCSRYDLLEHRLDNIRVGKCGVPEKHGGIDALWPTPPAPLGYLPSSAPGPRPFSSETFPPSLCGLL